MPKEKLYISPQGYQALEAQLQRYQQLFQTANHDIGASMSQSGGDWHENSQYEDGVSRARTASALIAHFQKLLKSVEVVEPNTHSAGSVEIGSVVTFVDREIGLQETYQIVGAFEGDPTNGTISFLSPLGAALFAHHVNDTVEIKPDDPRQERYQVQIISIA